MHQCNNGRRPVHNETSSPPSAQHGHLHTTESRPLSTSMRSARAALAFMWLPETRCTYLGTYLVGMIDELNRPPSQKGKNSARNAVVSHRNVLFYSIAGAPWSCVPRPTIVALMHDGQQSAREEELDLPDCAQDRPSTISYVMINIDDD